MGTPTLSKPDLLSQAYETLDLAGGRLLSPGSSPAQSGATSEEWTAVGEWLSLTERMGAERVFFVDEDPVIVFAQLPAEAELKDWQALYRRAWSLARPQCLFAASPDELRVYALNTAPTRDLSSSPIHSPLQVVKRAADIGEALAQFARPNVESGEAFEDKAFSNRNQRADRRLLADVRSATDRLTASGLSASLAHSLVERVLLVRYLEHREVVDTDYYREVAVQNPEWEALLSEPRLEVVNQAAPGIETVLADASFSAAVFRRLADDFNGDLFAIADVEWGAIGQAHLDLARGMLVGDDPAQSQLFLWAYDFSVVPVGLISSMYEQFFRASSAENDQSGTYYTPPELAQYAVHRALENSAERLPVMLDPSCGSGIFLVEGYKLLVRRAMADRGRRLRPAELATILRTKIFGIDINGDAVKLAAFSLYLTYLNFQRPSDIRKAGRLPKLVVDPGDPASAGTLFTSNAFNSTVAEAELSGDETDRLHPRLKLGSFDIVLGNPPWTEPPKGRHQMDVWCDSQALPVGDRSPSQAFLWRALSLTKPSGSVCLLLNASVLSNVRGGSKRFRQLLLRRVELRLLVNFTKVRSLFFSGGSAPFILFEARNSVPNAESQLAYLTVHPSRALRNTSLMGLCHLRRRYVRQRDLLARDYLWVAYSKGSHRDAALLSSFDAEESLGELLRSRGAKAALGWQDGGTKAAPDFIRDVEVLDVNEMTPWGPIDDGWLKEAPSHVQFPTKADLYHGRRLVVTRRAYADYGVHLRLVERSLTFSHSAYGVPMQAFTKWEAAVVYGILSSQLGRYVMYMHSGRWDVWFDEVTKGQLLAVPIRLGVRKDPRVRRILRTVDRIQGIRTRDLSSESALREARDEYDSHLRVLDAAVFDLFELTAAERDLISDFNLLHDGRSLPLLATADEERQETLFDVSRVRTDQRDLIGEYLDVFARLWNQQLPKEGRITGTVHVSREPAIACAVFSSRLDSAPKDSWSEVIPRLESLLSRRVTPTFYSDGVLRAVLDDTIVVAKRLEHHLWTRSAAREDVEATMVIAMMSQRP